MASTVPAGAKSQRPDYTKLVDLVFTPSAGDLSFLESWRPFISKYHIIVVSDSDGAIQAPAGLNVEVHGRKDMQQLLGSRASTIGAKEYGILVSKKDYVIVLDEDCTVATDDKGRQIDAISTHIENLSIPATPFFFNTLYDPFRQGADFVRGYPFSLREGTPTAVSHGLWLNSPDYDAPTQMAKALEKNTRYVDAVLTVPKGSLYPMSARNLAVNRSLIGAAMYFGVDAEGKPLGRNGATWAGMCSKVVADHLNYGCKTGLPYVWCAKPSTGAAMTNMQAEYKSILQQDEVLKFFQGLRLSASSATAEAAYLELAQQVRAKLGPVDPHFGRMAEAMESWIAAWKAVNGSC